jgi:hypothetical protein
LDVGDDVSVSGEAGVDGEAVEAVGGFGFETTGIGFVSRGSVLFDGAFASVVTEGE